LFFVPALQTRGGNVAVLDREFRPEWSGTGNGA
jgi:hypothetical protein